MKSKESLVLELFFNYPSKYWYFKELEKETGLAQSKLDRWLKRFQKEKIVLRIKEKGKRPYYAANYDAPEYKNKKRIFGLEKMHKSGLLNHLLALEKAKAVVIFGSFSRSDWYKESDIDIFIYGETAGLDLGKYQTKLHHEIQLFTGKREADLKKYGPGLLKNIIKGFNIKGDIPAEVIKNAAF